MSDALDSWVVSALDTGDLPAVPTLAAQDEVPLLLSLFDAQAQSRRLDVAQRWLQSRKEGFYTIGSAGHEGNAAVALALRPTDPALLHYRSGGFYAARAGQVPGSTPIADVLHGSAADVRDPISGGRHKVFGHARLAIIPQTSTIASHLPRAFGLAFAVGSRAFPLQGVADDAVVVCSFGDASANHSTAQGALNAAGYCAHSQRRLPLLLVCEDNGIGISTRTPSGWISRLMDGRAGLRYARAESTDPVGLLRTVTDLAAAVRESGAPALLHLGTVRFGGHAGSDVETAYRSRAEIATDHARDPILATAAALVTAGHPLGDLRSRYAQISEEISHVAEALASGPRRLSTAGEVMAPLTEERPAEVRARVRLLSSDRSEAFDGRLPESVGPLTLAQSVNAALRDTLAARPAAQVFGEDVARKGGVYGVTRGLRAAFGSTRVFDTLLDEQTVLGTALGAALAGGLPIPEIQYLAYLHNAEDQLRGEAASLRFFSAGQYGNGMIVRIAGLAYQKGFGGHFHNDNSLAVLRDIPGLVVAVPSGPAAAPALLRECIALAEAEQRVCAFVEPIALYHERDLHQPGDDALLAPYAPPAEWDSLRRPRGTVDVLQEGERVLLVTFGNGVRMSLRAAARLPAGAAGVLDLQWLSPLPAAALLGVASRYPAVLVVDETRASGGVSEGVVATLVDGGYAGRIQRITSRDTFVPLGPAADRVLLDEEQIVAAASVLLSHRR
ncbi:thiamine pyrophosphate-dependent enzyme [Microbacterium sp.]|uniref:thiamine pyrophosphate-dependent enzyme n=1 Tax=Microbacterium sp. TaxID=51671 RepID=UPI003C75BC2F